MHAMSCNRSFGDSVGFILELGVYVIGIFAVIFLFYTNSFLIKRRKKELGLYNILGMEKRHIAKTMFLENLYISVFSLIVGILSGVLLSKLMFMLLFKLLKFTVNVPFLVPADSIVTTIIMFAIIFMIIFLNNLRQVHLTKPIELLKGGQVGEKEPKTKWILTMIGIVSLGIGYYIAITTESPLSALSLFFVAVILVIIGTYCLFIAGSITILKLLRKNKKFYYKTKHFTSVSGMIYRMKQNAAGLASICILSTAVLLMLSSTVSLYIGSEDSIRNKNPRDISFNAILNNDTEKNVANISLIIEKTLEKNKITPINMVDFTYLTTSITQEHNKLSLHDDYNYNSVSGMIVLLDDYNKMENKSETLEDGQILIYSNKNKVQYEDITINGLEFHIKSQLDDIFAVKYNEMSILSSHYIVVKDMETFKAIQKATLGGYDMLSNYYIGFNADLDDEAMISYTDELRDDVKKDFSGYATSIADSRQGFYALYGGLFFLGIFLGALFIMATVLIIYYKQISEGYEDKERFAIMQKVGMSKQEVKSSIHSQVLMVFYLPLVVAVIHIAAAFLLITRLLAILGLTNVNLFLLCTIGTIVLFAIFYGIVYSLTARVYYKIVE